MSEVFIGKVYGGEFVIGKHEENGKDLLDVYSLILMPQQGGGFNAMIAPVMMPFNEGSIKSISLDKLIAYEPAPPAISQKYMEITTGLVIPPKPSGIQVVKG